MIPEWTFVAAGSADKCIKRRLLLCQFVEAPAREIWLSAEKIEEALQFRAFRQGTCITAVQLPHLLEGEVLQCEACADVEWRLVDVGDEQVGLSGIGDRHRQLLPGASGVERTFVMPRAE